MSFPKKPGGKALDVLQSLPRISLANLRPEPGATKAVRVSFFICVIVVVSSGLLLAKLVSLLSNVRQWRLLLTLCQLFLQDDALAN